MTSLRTSCYFRAGPAAAASPWFTWNSTPCPLLPSSHSAVSLLLRLTLSADAAKRWRHRLSPETLQRSRCPSVNLGKIPRVNQSSDFWSWFLSTTLDSFTRLSQPSQEKDGPECISRAVTSWYSAALPRDFRPSRRPGGVAADRPWCVMVVEAGDGACMTVR